MCRNLKFEREMVRLVSIKKSDKLLPDFYSFNNSYDYLNPNSPGLGAFF